MSTVEFCLLINHARKIYVRNMLRATVKRNSLKQAKDGATSLRISVIEAAKLKHSTAVFYAAPFYKELKRFYPFS